MEANVALKGLRRGSRTVINGPADWSHVTIRASERGTPRGPSLLNLASPSAAARQCLSKLSVRAEMQK